MSADGQRTIWRRNIAVNFNRLSRVHERYRQTTYDRRQRDGRPMTYSEHELEFTFTFVKRCQMYVIADVRTFNRSTTCTVFLANVHVRYMSSPVRLSSSIVCLSVICLSVDCLSVCNVGASLLRRLKFSPIFLHIFLRWPYVDIQIVEFTFAKNAAMIIEVGENQKAWHR